MVKRWNRLLVAFFVLTDSLFGMIAFVLAYVLKGQVMTKISDQGPAKIYKVGEMFFEPPGATLEESGNPSGAPVIFLHGGPGSGTEPNQRRFFDPSHYRIILLDQRGDAIDRHVVVLYDVGVGARRIIAVAQNEFDRPDGRRCGHLAIAARFVPGQHQFAQWNRWRAQDDHRIVCRSQRLDRTD